MSFSSDSNSHVRQQPSNKEVRYDRQLRLWGENGQLKLENAHVCLLNASAVGSEILKSLALPGVGSFTIIDHRKVTERDLESNFFVEESRLGCERAEVVRDFVLELNPDVSGKFIHRDVDSLCDNNDEKTILNGFDLVIGTDLNEQTVLNIGQYLADHRTPFIICKTYGLVAYLRLVLHEHYVIEAHPGFLPPNFLLDRPFPTLKTLVDSFDLEKLNHEQHSHVPFLVLLLKAIEKWAKSPDSGGKKFPTNYADKANVKKILLSMRMPDEKGNLDEENFHEAINAVASSVVLSTPLPDSVQRLFSDSRSDFRHQWPTPLPHALGDYTFGASTFSSFWTLCRALRRYVECENDGALPLRGDLPDMTSRSSDYLALQSVYYERATEQARRIFEIAIGLAKDDLWMSNDGGNENNVQTDYTAMKQVRSDETSPIVMNSSNVGHDSQKDIGHRDVEDLSKSSKLCRQRNHNPTDGLADKRSFPLTLEQTRIFCKNAAFLRVLELRTLAEEYSPKTSRMKAVHSQCYASDSGLDKHMFDFYVLLRACERFQAEKGRYPGTNGIPEHLDKLDLSQRVQHLAKVNHLPEDYDPEPNLVEEMCRYGAGEIHVVASFMGGLAAQEAIKIITGQYVPLNNTFIYDGNLGAGKSFEF